MKDKRPEDDRIQFSLPLNRRLLKYTLFITLIISLAYTLVTQPQSIIVLIGGLIDVLSPLIIGFCAAYVVNLLLRPLERFWLWIWRKRKNQTIIKKIKRPICLVLSFLIVIGIVFAILFMIVPSIKETIVSFAGRLDEYAKTIEKWYFSIAEFFGEYNFTLPEISLNTEKITQFAGKMVSDYGTNVISTTVNITASIFSAIIDIVLGLIFAIYLLAQKEKLSDQTRRAVTAILKPERAQKLVEFTALTNSAFTKFITGQLTEACVLGTLCFIGMWIFGMPYAIVISILIGFMALIPIFGAFIGTGIGALLILLEDPSMALWFVVFMIALQQIEGNVIYPKVVGKSVGLPGVWVLASATVGGGLFGVTGMLFSVPICAVLYAMFRKFVNKRNGFENESEENTTEIID